MSEDGWTWDRKWTTTGYEFPALFPEFIFIEKLIIELKWLRLVDVGTEIGERILWCSQLCEYKRIMRKIRINVNWAVMIFIHSINFYIIQDFRHNKNLVKIKLEIFKGNQTMDVKKISWILTSILNSSIFNSINPFWFIHEIYNLTEKIKFYE